MNNKRTFLIVVSDMYQDLPPSSFESYITAIRDSLNDLDIVVHEVREVSEPSPLITSPTE